MPVQLNHTIALATDAAASADQLAEILGLDEPRRYGPFHEVRLANDMTIDFMDSGGQPILGIHYAFLVTEDEFDEIFGRIKERGLDWWADPHKQQKGEINHGDGGRGLYWEHPDGHFLEILTVPYGGWPD
jgi:hypothetical protein